VTIFNGVFFFFSLYDSITSLKWNAHRQAGCSVPNRVVYQTSRCAHVLCNLSTVQRLDVAEIYVNRFEKKPKKRNNSHNGTGVERRLSTEQRQYRTLITRPTVRGRTEKRRDFRRGLTDAVLRAAPAPLRSSRPSRGQSFVIDSSSANESVRRRSFVYGR